LVAVVRFALVIRRRNSTLCYLDLGPVYVLIRMRVAAFCNRNHCIHGTKNGLSQ
jgi:hypothetical protein